MRTLVVLRGAPGSGKSEFVKMKKLEPYTISLDQLRLWYGSTSLEENGKLQIERKNEKKIYLQLCEILEARMKEGLFTVIDGTNIDADSFRRYRELAKKYRYRIFCVDFSHLEKEVIFQRNKQREEYKQVHEEILEDMYERITISSGPAGITMIKPEEFEEKVYMKPLDFSHYKKIHHIGDVHGCNTALQDFLGLELKDDELYIFVGDYLDRGIENGETASFLFSIMDKPNVIFLKGNHERHSWKWANNEKVNSREFEKYTQVQLEEKQIDKKLMRMFLRKLYSCICYKYEEKTVLVTHGGLSTLPENLTFISEKQMIGGVGDYHTPIDELFTKQTESHVYQIHGHRNLQRLPIQVTERTFNLEGQIEMGGHLRAVTLSKKGFETHEVPNPVASKRMMEMRHKNLNENNAPILKILRENKDIKEKQLPKNISSFNFKTKVFYDRKWDAQTMKARGLFINTITEEIVARSYEKFFNLNEVEETKMETLKEKLVFPLTAYQKENGYLGILGYDSLRGELVYCSKTDTNNSFVTTFENLFVHSTTNEIREEISEYLRKEKSSLVFEVIEPEFSPHVIAYEKPKIVLLDIIKRNIVFEKKSYDELKEKAADWHLLCKEKEVTLYSWKEFLEWHEKNQNDKENKIEGFVLEDKNGFQFKIKTPYYSYWKNIRNCMEQILHGKRMKFNRIEDPLTKEMLIWFKNEEAPDAKPGWVDILKMKEKYSKKTKKRLS